MTAIDPLIVEGITEQKAAATTAPVFWVVVAVDEAKDYVPGYIARSQDAIDRDLLINGNPEDDGFDHNWLKSITTGGVFKLMLAPWGHRDDFTGEYDTGIDVVSFETLWTYQP